MDGAKRKEEVFSLYLQEYFLPIHHPKDEVDDGGIAEGDKCSYRVLYTAGDV